MPSIKLSNPYAPKQSLDRELQLPDLDTFEFGPLPELGGLDEPSLSIGSPPPEPVDDIWEVALNSGPAYQDVEFFTWEAFEDDQYVDRRTCYITESGPMLLDAALAKDEEHTASGRVIQSHVFVDSLFNLGLGRSSVLFNFDTKLKSFVPAIQDGRSSGSSLIAAQSFTERFVLVGNICLFLHSFVERTFASGTSVPAKVALATCVSSVVSTLEDHLGKLRPQVHSLLQLQRTFEKPWIILAHIARMVDAVRAARSNEQVSSILHHRAQEIEEGDFDLWRLSCQLLARVSRPSLDLLGEWIGISDEERTMPIAQRATFIAAEGDSETGEQTEYTYDPDGMPRYVSSEDGEMIFETGNSLRFMRIYHPEHPLSSPAKFGIQGRSFEWTFEWNEIENIAAKAKSYEEDLRRAISDFVPDNEKASTQLDQSNPNETSSSEKEGSMTEVDFAKYFETSTDIFDQDPKRYPQNCPDELQVLVEQVLSHTTGDEGSQNFRHSPPLEIISILSFRPLLTVQAKLVNATTLRLFFRSHQLRMHLSVQRQYHLFGDGVFSSRLASALFDPERETAERQKGTMRSGVQMGLQVGSRTTWPPASSELRLALMGVLSESFYSSALYHSTLPHSKHTTQSAGYQPHDTADDLPGQLNFAVRELSEPEMNKTLDPDSLYALDFLRLQYVPPSPLNLVITNTSLEKYDYIFRFLLRLSRMLFVVSHLPREYADVNSRRFRAEAHHFVTALSHYIFQTGIAESWDSFFTYITTIETRLAAEDAANELGTLVTEGLEAVKSAHDKCLDSIMFALLLRRRQKKVMTLLEEIFEHILLFAKMQKPDSTAEETVHDLYAKLRGKIKVFISVCRGLTGKRGYGKGKGMSEANTMERLLVLLEMNDYHGG